MENKKLLEELLKSYKVLTLLERNIKDDINKNELNKNVNKNII